MVYTTTQGRCVGAWVSRCVGEVVTMMNVHSKTLGCVVVLGDLYV